MQPLRGGLAPLTLPTYIPVSSWWLSGGISAANCIAAYAPKGAASLAESYVNFANPGTYNAAPGTAPNFNTLTGWGFTGTQYLKTGVVPAALTWSLLVKINVGNSTGNPVGSLESTTKRFHIYLGNTTIYWGNGNVLAVAKTISGELVLGFTNRTAYYNGAAVAGTIPTGATTILESYIGARNDSGTATNHFVGSVFSAAWYNASLTDAQMIAVGAAMP